MVECKQDKLAKSCPCTYSCSKRGKCCDCIASHRSSRELPACYFTAEQERTYDRSIDYYCKVNGIK